MKRRKIILIICAFLLVAAAVGGTLALLTDISETVENNFTIGDVEIAIEDGAEDKLPLLPGGTHEKDTRIVVKAGSEDAWLFVSITEANGLRSYVDYRIADGWEPLAENPGVYYRSVPKSDTDTAFPVILDGKITVSTTVTKEMLEAIGKNPILTIHAYAVQKQGLDTADEGWTEILEETER